MPFDVSRVGTYFANYSTPRGIEFSIDRQSVEDTEASHRYAAEIAQLVNLGYREFLKKVEARSAKSIFELNAQSRMRGGEVCDSCTGRELADAYFNYADLLCFKLIQVYPDQDVKAVQPEYLDLNALTKKSGTIWCIQNHYNVPLGAGRVIPFYDEALLPFTYSYAIRRLKESQLKEEMYVVESHRVVSMLFDCDPDSTVEFFDAKLVPTAPANLCIERISVGSVRFGDPAQGVLAEVQGRWTGAIYLRNFETPERKPYVFLGRHRVLIQKSSRLRSYLEDLKVAGRLIKLAETVALLQDDEAGFKPAAIAGLL